MSVTVECDVCLYRCDVKESRLGEKKPCKKCGSRFVLEEAGPPPDPTADPNAPTPLQKFFGRAAKVATGIGIALLLTLMVSLIWTNPRAAWGAASSTSEQPSLRRVSSPQRPAIPDAHLEALRLHDEQFEESRRRFTERFDASTQHGFFPPAAPANVDTRKTRIDRPKTQDDQSRGFFD